MRHHVELAHQITVLYNWAMNPDKDTISALSNSQAKQASDCIKDLWAVLERRGKK